MKKRKPTIAPSLFVLLLLFALPFAFKGKELQTALPATAPVEQACEVLIQVQGQQKPISLEQYLLGVVAGEMPISFHKEALKAQAIAARTYVLKTTEGGKKSISPTVANQVYIDETARKAKWGTLFSQHEATLQEAIKETTGQVVMYDGVLITAMFHSMSNGQTESARGFSGNDVPYLNSVDSTFEKNLPNFTQQKIIPLQQWQQYFGNTNFANIILERNASGRVDQMHANNKQWQGREVREWLDLRSTDFDIAYSPSTKLITVTTRGYGHGVGMSQYGADAMAKQGKTATDIILYYYQPAKISKWNGCLK